MNEWKKTTNNHYHVIFDCIYVYLCGQEEEDEEA